MPCSIVRHVRLPSIRRAEQIMIMPAFERRLPKYFAAAYRESAV